MKDSITKTACDMELPLLQNWLLVSSLPMWDLIEPAPMTLQCRFLGSKWENNWTWKRIGTENAYHYRVKPPIGGALTRTHRSWLKARADSDIVLLRFSRWLHLSCFSYHWRFVGSPSSLRFRAHSQGGLTFSLSSPPMLRPLPQSSWIWKHG